MKYQEVKMNVFDNTDDYYFAQCISSDCKMGAGIAVEFQKRFNLRDELMQNTTIRRQHPTCILVGRVFNLITKEKYFHKPTYDTMEKALKEMKEYIIAGHITKIAMPKIGSKLDKLDWNEVRGIIYNTFEDLDIEIKVCYI